MALLDRLNELDADGLDDVSDPPRLPLLPSGLPPGLRGESSERVSSSFMALLFLRKESDASILFRLLSPSSLPRFQDFERKSAKFLAKFDARTADVEVKGSSDS